MDIQDNENEHHTVLVSAEEEGFPPAALPPFRPRRTLRACALAFLLVRIPPLNSIPTKKVPQAPFLFSTETVGFELGPKIKIL